MKIDLPGRQVIKPLLQPSDSWNGEEKRAMSITIKKAPVGTRWIVMLGSHPVAFRTELEASDFVDKLKARIDAPHKLPIRLSE